MQAEIPKAKGKKQPKLKAQPQPAKHAGGRPKKLTFDDAMIKQANLFGYFKATYETMAEFLGCHIDTIRDAMRNNEEFSNAYKNGMASLKMKLSEAQIQSALTDRNATMLIWLGKQYLGQKDQPESDAATTPNIILKPKSQAESDTDE